MLPPILAAQELLVVLPARGRRGAPGVAVRLVLLVACAAAYIALRLVLMAPEGASHYSLKSASLAESQLIRRAENPLAFVRGRLEWALSVGWLQVYFAKLLFVPTTYCVEYSYDCVPMVEELSDGRNALTLALLLALLRFAAHLLARAGRPDARATMALSAWLLLPWALVSHVPLRLGTLIAERTLYLPSAGALLLVAHILRPPPRASAVRRRWWGRRAAPLVGLAVGVLARRCLLRTLDWRTDETAFVAAVAVCPRSSKIQQQMCTLRTNQGQLAAARVHCAAAHAIDPEFCDVRFSMGSLAVASGDEGGAIDHYNASLPCPFTATKAYPMLLRVYDLVHRRSPKNGTLHEQIASTHSVVGNTAAAATLYREAAALHLAANRPRDALRAVAAAEAAHRRVGPLVEASCRWGRSRERRRRPTTTSTRGRRRPIARWGTGAAWRSSASARRRRRAPPLRASPPTPAARSPSGAPLSPPPPRSSAVSTMPTERAPPPPRPLPPPAATTGVCCCSPFTANASGGAAGGVGPRLGARRP